MDTTPQITFRTSEPLIAALRARAATEERTPSAVIRRILIGKSAPLDLPSDADDEPLKDSTPELPLK